MLDLRARESRSTMVTVCATIERRKAASIFARPVRARR
jgi:hypothetical protein